MNIEEFKRTRDWQIIQTVIQDLDQQEIIERARGYCFSVSDMAYQLLIRRGLDCELTECRLTVFSADPPQLSHIGHDQQSRPGEISTHVVCMVNTEIPVLIDLSVCGLHPKIRWICEPCTARKSGEIAEFDFGHSRWLYQEKLLSQAPIIANKNIVERLIEQRKIKNDLRLIKLGLIALGMVVVLNAIRGGYDFYQTYIVEDNFWGPHQIKK